MDILAHVCRQAIYSLSTALTLCSSTPCNVLCAACFHVAPDTQPRFAIVQLQLLYDNICFTSISYVFACAIEDSSLSEEWLTVTGETIMSRRLPSLCVSAGGTTRPLDAAVEQADIHTRTHTHARAHTRARTHTHTRAGIRQTEQNNLLLSMSAYCRLFLTLEFHQSLLQMRAPCA